MVEIIGFDESVAKQKTCGHCSAILKYLPKDIHRRDGTDIGGGPDGAEWIVCPSCGQNVILRSW